jgi:hypothetical protein
MKYTRFILAAGLIIGLSMSACRKNSLEEFETTFELSGNQAIAENLTEDARDLLDEVAVDKNLMGARETQTAQTMNNLSCATVTVPPHRASRKIS